MSDQIAVDQLETPATEDKPKLTGRGGPGRGGGRKPGSVNKVAQAVKDLAGNYSEAAIERAAEIAQLKTIKLFNRNGTPKMVKAFNADGSPKIDKKRQQVMVQAEGYMHAPITTQLAAAQFIVERAAGKPPQPLANDIDNPLTDVKPAGKITVAREPAAPLPTATNDNEQPPRISPYFNNKDFKPEEPTKKTG